MDRSESADDESQSMQADQHPCQRNATEYEIRALVRRNAVYFEQPFPIIADQFVEVRTRGLTRYFKSIRNSCVQIADIGRPTLLPDADSIISEENFINVCRYLTASRVSRVFNIFCGRDEGISMIPQDFALPVCFADKINRIGVVTVQGGAYRVCPKPEPNPVDPDPEEFRSMLVQFASLVESAEAHGGLSTTRGLASSIEGSSWWFLTARSVFNHNIVVKNDSEDVVIVSACHREWTNMDGLHCATIRNEYDGLIPTEKVLKWSIGTVRTRNGWISRPDPGPVAGDQHVGFFPERMNPYFAALRRWLLEVAPSNWRTNEADTIISEDDFVDLCRYLVTRRVNYVCRGFYNANHDQISNPPPNLEYDLPHRLCQLINGVGIVKVHDGQYTVCPKLERSPFDFVSAPTSEVRNQFVDLIEAARRSSSFSTGTISTSIKGTSWWLLTARSLVNPDVIASELDTVVVYGSHKEWNIRDAVLCALVQNRFDGILPIENTLKWSIGTFRRVSAIHNLHHRWPEVYWPEEISSLPP